MKEELPTNVAAIDLGSNSFHMIVCKLEKGKLRTIDRLREMVRLASGLDDHKKLDNKTQIKALECLERFGQRIRNFPPGSVRIVGTNTLRIAKNSQEFIRKAEKALGHPIDIIAGIEEARLIYQGVANSLGSNANSRFVMDIGGGSTEYIIGINDIAHTKESLKMGCVTVSNKFFKDGIISKKSFKKATLYAQQKLEPYQRQYDIRHWDEAIGASGSLRCIDKVLVASKWSKNGITKKGLEKLVSHILKCKHLDDLNLPALADERLPVFLGGVIIIYATFLKLGIEQMTVSDGALREGLVHDLLGRIYNDDIRSQTVKTIAEHYLTDQEHCKRIQQTVDYMLNQLDNSCCTGNSKIITQFLLWAVSLHEIGRNIAHSQYHKHGAYIIENGDFAGFSRQDQQLLATLVLSHRKRFSSSMFKKLPEPWNVYTPYLAIILRLAILLHRNRHTLEAPKFKISIQATLTTLTFNNDWLNNAPLTETDLKSEARYLKDAGYTLIFS
ncbi:MAG: Ppx/GppA family phosphatase [Methylococcales symbiont of Iophon sp. n. MRB-2018]|nr:MAG: Ppx/GppA family phosphatase [Methylococcales symbiont of Iophon sp. n. MRB-2018]KAF3979042.1 MAG: Ppx/GppA family phosphatase [Methylococcales symbiont of Iophon sp. n. MRB-2018]